MLRPEHITKLKAYAIRLSDNNEADGEDLLQELALKMYEIEERFRNIPDNEVGKIVNVSLKNLAMDKYRKQKRVGRNVLYIEDMVQSLYNEGFIKNAMTFEDQQPLTKNLGYSKLLCEQVFEYLETLPEKQVEVFLLTCISDYKFRVIAEAMDTSINTTIGRARYIRQKLRAFLEESTINHRRSRSKTERVTW